MNLAAPDASHPVTPYTELDRKLERLEGNKGKWIATTVAERIAILAEIKECLMPTAQAWVEAAARHKGIASGSSLVGEEWFSGPYLILSYCNQMMRTLSKVGGNRHLDGVAVRILPNGQIAAKVFPHSMWDRLLLNGVTAEVWMQPEVSKENLSQYTASIYDPDNPRWKTGKVALVLGAGNIASIAPLDVFGKLFSENQVVMLKLNPVNDYLIEFLVPALKPLIDRGVLCIVHGAADVGQYLCSHAAVEEIHLTGSVTSHDAIVWGAGGEGHANKAAGTPKNRRKITSELGAVCPTIVVPGPWSNADIQFQAEQVATQKLHNSGFNCIACQILILPKDWAQKASFVSALDHVISSSEGGALYYPGTKDRLATFVANNPSAKVLHRSSGEDVLVAKQNAANHSHNESIEVFAPAFAIEELPNADPESYLQAAIDYANTRLFGTLGANIVIHPHTIAQIGRARLEEILIGLHYGTIAINTWSAIGFQTPQLSWGAFPGHTLADVQSGIGIVHNTLLFDRPQRSVIEAPFKPFPRNFLSLSFSLLPYPPWFITHRRANILGRLLVDFQYRPSLLKIPRIFLTAVLR